MDLTEAEDIKNGWQQYTEELYNKGLNDPDNHDCVISQLEPDILQCEVKWALGRSPGGEHGNSLQYSCLENPMDRGAWWATVHRVTMSQIQLRLVRAHAHTHTPTHTHTHAHTHTHLTLHSRISASR